MQLKISPTLLDAFDWYKTAPQSWKQRAYDNIVDKINRTPFVPTPAIKKGFAFEDAVEKHAKAVANGGEYKGSQHFQGVVAKCAGGVWQTWQRGFTNIGSEYGIVDSVGKLDCMFPIGSAAFPHGHIIDLKTTAHYRGSDKYTSGWQHLFYCSWMGILTFEYIIAEWESNEPGNKTVKDVHSVPVSVNIDDATARMRDGLLSFFAFLKTHNLWDAYVYTYCKNPR